MTPSIASVEEVVAGLMDIHPSDVATGFQWRAVQDAISVIKSLTKDAARYRYLRSDQEKDFIVQQTYPKMWSACNGPHMDDAIDCAIERGPRPPEDDTAIDLARGEGK